MFCTGLARGPVVSHTTCQCLNSCALLSLDVSFVPLELLGHFCFLTGDKGDEGDEGEEGDEGDEGDKG